MAEHNIISQKRIRFSHFLNAFLISGFLFGFFEIIYTTIRRSPSFIVPTEKYLFYLAILGLMVIMALILSFVWQGFYFLYSRLLVNRMGINFDSLRRIPNHLIFFCTWIFIYTNYELTLFFLKKFHNHDMISFTLALSQGIFVGFLLLCTAVFAQKNILHPQTKKMHGTRSRTIVSFIIRQIINPVYLSVLAILVLFQFNREWLGEVLDIPYLIFLTCFGCSTYAIYRLMKLHPFHFMNRLPFMITVLLLCLLTITSTAFTINYSNNLNVSIHKFSVIPDHILSDLSRVIDIKAFPALIKAPIESGDFDLKGYFEAKAQEFEYDDRPLAEIIGDTSDWNVILLSIDAVRSDHLSCYGYPFPTSPHLDTLAENGVLLERNYIQGGDTPNSINSFTSGIYAINFQRNATKLMKDILKEHGFTTGFVGYNEILKNHPFRQGYDDLVLFDTPYNEIFKSTSSEKMITEIKSMIDRNKDKRFFIYSHLLDPHAGYIRTPQTDQFVQSKQMLYDGEIAHTDFWIGNLIEHLEKLGLMDHTLLVITSDHGEEFKEHGNSWHGKFLYNESIHTPVIMNLPGIQGRRVKVPTGSVDIVPTILAFLGIEADPPRDGTNLLPLIYHGDHSALTPVYSMIPNANYKKFGVIFGPWKFIYNQKEKTFELYNYEIDPEERMNQVDRYPNVAKKLRDLLAEHYPNPKNPIPEIAADNVACDMDHDLALAPSEKKSGADPKKNDELGESTLPSKSVSQPSQSTDSSPPLHSNTELNEPRDVAFGPDCHYAVADFRNYRVAVFDQKDNLITQFGEKGNKISQFEDPCGIDFSKDNFIYVADTFNQRVQKYDASGNIVWTAGYRFCYPMDVVAASDGIWVSNTSMHELIKLDFNGKMTAKIVGAKGSKSALQKPVGIALDTEENIYVADSLNKEIKVFNREGTYLRSIPINGWQEQTYTLPYLCFDTDGHLFVTDPPNHRILAFNPATGEQIGQYPVEVGADTKSEFMFPMGVSYCPATDELAVVDCKHNRIVRLSCKMLLAKRMPMALSKS